MTAAVTCDATSLKDTVVIFGATSGMAEQVVRLYAERGSALVLVARNEEKLEAVAQDAKVRGARAVMTLVQDLSDLAALPGVVEQIFSESDGVSTVLIAHGVLPNQEELQDDIEKIRTSLDLNFTGPVMIITEVVKQFLSQNSGTLAVITSVAGDRARQSNYVYGVAKGGLSLYLQGVRNRLGKTPISVVDIRPGFVSTPMTAHLAQGPLFASAESVATGIVKAIESKQDIVYLPWFWRYILMIIKAIPESIFKRLSL